MSPFFRELLVSFEELCLERMGIWADTPFLRGVVPLWTVLDTILGCRAACPFVPSGGAHAAPFVIIVEVCDGIGLRGQAHHEGDLRTAPCWYSRGKHHPNVHAATRQDE